MAKTQQLQSDIDNAKAAVDIASLNLSLLKVGYNDSIDIECQENIEKMLAVLKSKSQELRIKVDKKNTELAKHQLVLALKKACKLRTQLQQLNCKAGLTAYSTAEKIKELQLLLKKMHSDYDEIAQLTDNAKQYDSYNNLRKKVKSLSATIKIQYDKIVHLSECELPNICEQAKVLDDWKRKFYNTKNRNETYQMLRDDKFLNAACSNTIKTADTITGGFFNLSKRYQDQLTEQKQRDFFICMYDIDQLKNEKTQSEGALDKCSDELRRLNPPTEQEIQQLIGNIAKKIPLEGCNTKDLSALLPVVQHRFDLLQQSIENNTKCCQLLTDLHQLQTQILQLRADFYLFENDTAYLNEATQLDIAPQQAALSLLLSELQSYETPIKQLQPLLLAHQKMQRYSVEHSSALTPNNTQLSTLITQLHANLSHKIAHLAIAPVSCVDKPLSLAQWQQKITSSSQNLPQDLQTWINNLVALIQHNQLDSAQPFECQQLLRDIYMELQQYSLLSNGNVLWKYYHLCPDKDDIAPLLNLKPPIPLNKTQPLPRLQHQDLQYCIDVLTYNQKKCPSPHHATLIKQAVHSIHYFAWKKEQNAQYHIPNTIKNMMHDPRYECLQQHNGMVNLWNYLLKALYALVQLMRPSQPIHYKDSFFYCQNSVERHLNTAIGSALAIGASA